MVDNLWFPNGLAVSPDNQFVVVAESSKFRLVKYYINGPKKGAFEVFATGLPGKLIILFFYLTPRGGLILLI